MPLPIHDSHHGCGSKGLCPCGAQASFHSLEGANLYRSRRVVPSEEQLLYSRWGSLILRPVGLRKGKARILYGILAYFASCRFTALPWCNFCIPNCIPRMITLYIYRSGQWVAVAFRQQGTVAYVHLRSFHSAGIRWRGFFHICSLQATICHCKASQAADPPADGGHTAKLLALAFGTPSMHTERLSTCI